MRDLPFYLRKPWGWKYPSFSVYIFSPLLKYLLFQVFKYIKWESIEMLYREDVVSLCCIEKMNHWNKPSLCRKRSSEYNDEKKHSILPPMNFLSNILLTLPAYRHCYQTSQSCCITLHIWSFHSNPKLPIHRLDQRLRRCF